MILTNLRISTRLWLITAFACALFAVAIGVALYSLRVASDSLHSIHDDRMVPLESLSKLAGILRENRTEMYRVFLHFSGNPVLGESGQQQDAHLALIDARVAEADGIWSAYLATTLTDEEVKLAADFVSKRVRWLAYMNEIRLNARSGQLTREAVKRFSDMGETSFQQMMDALIALRNYQVNYTQLEYEAAGKRYLLNLVVFDALALIGILGLMTLVRLTLRRINNGLKEASLTAQAIADGNLSATIATNEKDEIGELMAHIGTMRNSLRTLLDNLSRSEGRSRAILRTMRDGVIHIDQRGRILAVNDVISELFGFDEEELLGQNVSILMPEPYRSAHDGYLSNYFQFRKPVVVGTRREVEGQRKNGTRFPMDLSVNEMVDDEGSTFIGIIRDISEQKANLLVLKDALEVAQAASRTKGEFLANMSHEIRTPINAVLGFSHLCLTLGLPPRGRDYVEKTRIAAESLLGIVNDILDFSKIEAGKLEMENESFSLGDVLHAVAHLFGQKSREKGIELVIGAEPGIPDRLMGDALRLRQVLTNLVGNAVKFTERGEISLTVSAVEVSGEQALLNFEIRDTGVGMSREQQLKLFNAFSQADNTITRKYGGTGLGLAISKQLVEQMGGEISVESEPGLGSCFRFSARYGVDKETVVRRVLRTPISGKHILIADDNAVIRTLLSHQAESLGCRVTAVNSGETVLEKLKTDESVDAVILDWRMVGLDGLETARRIRATGCALPVILVTGDEPELARAQSGNREIQAFLAKPVSRSTLHDTLSELLGGHAVLPPPQIAPNTLPNLHGYKILLVDDNDFNRQVGRELIALTGATVDTVENGIQAVAAVGSGNYALVLMDLQMPEMDGYTAARTIRATRPDLPILALTAHAMIEERERVLAAGMNDILTKPILPDLLYAALACWLKPVSYPDSERRQRSDRRQALTERRDLSRNRRNIGGESECISENVVSASPVAPIESEVPCFDLEAALSRVNGNRAMLERFLRMFVERNAATVDNLEAALVTREFETARRLAHALKGGAGTVGMLALQAVAGELERSLQATAQGDGEYDDLLRRLKTAWQGARETIAVMTGASVGEETKTGE